MHSRRVHGPVLLSLILLSAFLLGCGSDTIHPTAVVPPGTDPSGSRTIHTALSLGPIEGLTTAWHPIAFLNEDPPRDPEIFTDLEPAKGEIELVVPLGVDLRFRCGVPTGGVVEWEGASEVDRVGALSTALCRLDTPQVTRVTAQLRTPDGEGQVSVRLRAIDVDLDRVRVQRPRITVDRLEADDVADNASSVETFLGSSIADLGSDAEGLVTSVDRFLDLEAVVEPAELAPLVEWSIDGAPRLLAATARLRLLRPGRHEIRVGSGVGARTVPVTAYRVRIVRDASTAGFAEATPLTFRAETIPAGYEDRVRWLASTRSGSATPALGSGPVFTTTFRNTTDAAGRWAGVKADHAKADFDADPAPGGPEVGLEIEVDFADSAVAKATVFNYPRVRAWFHGDSGDQIHDIGVERETPGNPGGPWMAGLTGCRVDAEHTIADNGDYAVVQSYRPVFIQTTCVASGAIKSFVASGLGGTAMNVDGDPNPDEQTLTWSGPDLGDVTWIVDGAVLKVEETATTVTVRAIAVGTGRVIGRASKDGQTCELIANIPVGQ